MCVLLVILGLQLKRFGPIKMVHGTKFFQNLQELLPLHPVLSVLLYLTALLILVYPQLAEVAEAVRVRSRMQILGLMDLAVAVVAQRL
jgi:hypothetical protein